MLATLGVVAKLEHRRTKEQTTRSRAIVKAQGMKFGHKPKLMSRQQREAAARVAAGEPRRALAQTYNGSRSAIAQLPSAEVAYG